MWLSTRVVYPWCTRYGMKKRSETVKKPYLLLHFIVPSSVACKRGWSKGKFDRWIWRAKNFCCTSHFEVLLERIQQAHVRDSTFFWRWSGMEAENDKKWFSKILHHSHNFSRSSGLTIRRFKILILLQSHILNKMPNDFLSIIVQSIENLWHRILN
jgi:hypothetical protein